MPKDYSDIINIKNHELLNHQRMPIENRAFQFSPFKALNGYDEALEESRRITDNRKELLDDLENDINLKLQIIKKNLNNKIKCRVTYFVKDVKKAGGYYNNITGIVKKVDEDNKRLIFDNNKTVFFDSIIELIIQNI